MCKASLQSRETAGHCQPAGVAGHCAPVSSASSVSSAAADALACWKRKRPAPAALREIGALSSDPSSVPTWLWLACSAVRLRADIPPSNDPSRVPVWVGLGRPAVSLRVNGPADRASLSTLFMLKRLLLRLGADRLPILCSWRSAWPWLTPWLRGNMSQGHGTELRPWHLIKVHQSYV
jgi:hypothetical protein